MKITSKLFNYSVYRAARAYISILSQQQKMISRKKCDQSFFENEYLGQPILLLALYEKGILRPDIEKLLRAAKEQGLYILCINTLTLKDPNNYQGLMDCYIERYNFGRDFGSYKSGFSHIYKRHWDNQCPRLLMLNDSVYYSSRGLSNFIKNMCNNSYEVLGATENHEMEHHFGSFCISITNNIISSTQLKRYWNNYKNSDVRPTVIKKGEMALSKTLKHAASSSNKIKALFDTNYFLSKMLSDRSIFEAAISYTRQSKLVGWPQCNTKEIVKQILDKHLVRTTAKAKGETEEPYDFTFVSDYNSIITNIKQISDNCVDDKVDEFILTTLADVFKHGSQVHQNAAILLLLGLPFIKLDGLYRGMFSTEDIYNISKLLSTEEAESLRQLLLSKPFGGDVLVGWKRTAFYRGLI